MNNSYIAIEGPIGVGKTTLAQKLADQMSAEILLEAPDENPFLERFYDDPEINALPVQLSFLVQRARQVDQLRQSDMFSRCWISDFMFDRDRIFAELNLSGHELELYVQIFRRLAWQVPQPDCVIYLHAPVDTLLQRVRQRGRIAENSIQKQYLERVAQDFSRFFAHYSASRVIRVDALKYDLVHNPGHFSLLLESLKQTDVSYSLE